jgi:phosphoribosyl 1,2-cyclic phosphodiesterase
MTSSSLVVLGTGTSEGVPRVSCLTSPDFKCRTCLDAAQPGSLSRRRNTSLLVRHEGKNILIDCGKMFWEGAIEHFPRLKVRKLDAIILTHDHADAVLGLDDLRDWTMNVDGQRGATGYTLPIYLVKRDFESIKRAFPYLVDTNQATGGGQVPSLRFHVLEDERAPFEVCGVTFFPVLMTHGVVGPQRLPYICRGYRFGDAAWLSDCSEISPEAEAVVRRTDGPGLLKLKTLFIDALKPEDPHSSHFNLHQAIAFAKSVQPEQALLVGMSHQFAPHHEANKQLEFHKEPTVALAFDGMVLDWACSKEFNIC